MTHNGDTRLRPRAQALLDAATHAGEFQPHLVRPYVVKGWLDQSAISVIYGPSNVGKSFLALDIAYHVAKELTWHGARVTGGNVLYVAAEGGASFENRVAALDGPRFWVIKTPLSLYGKQSDALPLVEMVEHLSKLHGGFNLVVFDTLARVMGGGDENTAPDIANLVANLDAIRTRTEAHIMLVHHSGKDLARGARGHSSLRAAIDTEIVLSRDDDSGVVSALLDKQRDGATGTEFHYSLRAVVLGKDQDGDPVTTCIVQADEPPEAERAELKGPARMARDMLDNLLSESGDRGAVLVEEWRKKCLDLDGLSKSPEREARRKAFGRAMKVLMSRGDIQVAGDFVERSRQ